MPIKCNCESGGKCEIHPKKPASTDDRVGNLKSTNAIDPADQLTLKKLEAEYLKAQLKVRDAQQQLEMFGAMLYQKLGLRSEEWSLDISVPAFVKKG